MKLPSVGISLCLGLVAVVYSAAIEKKEDAKKLRSIAGADDLAKISEDVGEDLLRDKKSPTTTFCVEIKSGDDEPTIVACDPAKSDIQQPIPPHLPTIILPPPDTPNPHPHPEQPPPPPQPIYEPIGIISQPQIFPPYYPPQPPTLPPWYPQPVPQTQIIFVKDPNCNSNHGSNPIPSPWSTIPSGGYGTRPKSAMDYDGYKNIEDEMRSFSGLQQLSSNGLYQNPLDLIYTRQGTRPNQNNPQSNQPQINPLSNQSPQFNQQANQPSQHNQQPNQLPQYNQQLDQQNRPTGIIPQPPTPHNPGQNQFDKPLLIQCNPTVIPLSPAAYAAATNSQSNYPNFRTLISGTGGTEPSQFIYQPAISGKQALYTPYGGQDSSYVKNAQYESYAPEGINYQQLQSNKDGFALVSGQGRAAENSQGIAAPMVNPGQIPNISTKGMQTGPQAGENAQQSQSSQLTPQNQGSQGEAKELAMDHQQIKDKNMAQLTQDQGTQKQVEFNEQGHQQVVQNVPGIQQHQPQQKSVHDQRMMQSFKSRTNMPQGNILNPSYGYTGKRQADIKHRPSKFE